MIPLAVVTPLILILCVAFGALVGWWLLLLVRAPLPEEQREKDEEIAKCAAKKAVDEAFRELAHN